MRTKNKSGFTVVEAVVIVVLIAVVVAGISMAKKKTATSTDVGSVTTEPTTTPATTEAKKTETKTTTAAKTDKTADWKTFSSNQYGYSVKYPAAWKVEDISKFGIVTFADPTKQADNEKQKQGDGGELVYNIVIVYASSVATESENVSNKWGAKTLAELMAKTDMITPIGDTTLGGQPAKDMIIRGYMPYTIMSIHNGHFYKVATFAAGKNDLSTEVKQILASFTFTK
ncbi:MAG: hypothetical protein Q7S64_01525 [bacterium]|nr:hypothetical protein [bacterium]